VPQRSRQYDRPLSPQALQLFDCGAPQTSLQNGASLRGINLEVSAGFWIALVSAQSMV
jgi:hypothetical protein